MRENTRSMVAYIAAKLVLGNKAAAIFDHSRGLLLQINGSVTEDSILAHDPERDCEVSGSGQDGAFRLFHHRDLHPIDLMVEGQAFEGFDHGATCFFSGEVSQHCVGLFDYGQGSHFSYSIREEEPALA